MKHYITVGPLEPGLSLIFGDRWRNEKNGDMISLQSTCTRQNF